MAMLSRYYHRLKNVIWSVVKLMDQIEAQLMKIGDELARVIKEVHNEILAREEDDPFRIVGYNNAGQGTMYIDQTIEDAVFNYLSGLDVNGIF